MLSWGISLLSLCIFASRGTLGSTTPLVTTALLPHDLSPFSDSKMLGFLDDGSSITCSDRLTATFSGNLFACASVGETISFRDPICIAGGAPSPGGYTCATTCGTFLLHAQESVFTGFACNSTPYSITLHQTPPTTSLSAGSSESVLITATTLLHEPGSTPSQTPITAATAQSSATSTSQSSSTAAATILAGFNPASTQNVAVYWGQNSGNVGQERLAYYCNNANIDIINIAFITGITPVTVNFASAGDKCSQSMNNTGLLLCKEIEEDIKECQRKNKTILISMGGSAPTASNWSSTADAEKSAQLIWDMFGPVPSGKMDRPFGSAVVDGFDFDFETSIKNLPAFGRKLRHLMDAATEKTFFLSAAPQCVFPDANVGTTLDAVRFDIVQIQFYNNPCGLSQFQEGNSDSVNFNFPVWDLWAQKSKNPNIKIFIGIPAGPAAANQGSYTDGLKLKSALNWAKEYRSFGGVMMWDVAQLYANREFLPEVVSNLQDGNQPYLNKTFASTATPISSPRISSSPLIIPFSSSSSYPLGTSSYVSSPSSLSGIAIAQWGQCGGHGYTGSTRCQPPYRCVSYSPWWSDCR